MQVESNIASIASGEIINHRNRLSTHHGASLNGFIW
jgi:hypothetical protein